MEMKHDVWVYVELINGKPGQVSLELLGKGRELADSRGVSVVGLLIGQGAAEAAQSVIGYGADSVVVVEDAALQQFNALLFAKAAAAVIVKYEPNVVLIGASHDGRDLGGRLSALLGLGLVADCIDCSYADDSDSITWIRPAYTGKLLVKILTTTRPQLATISDRIFRGNAFDGARQEKSSKNRLICQGCSHYSRLSLLKP
jgi:electron transfer flavoprotein alpha subunit